MKLVAALLRLLAAGCALWLSLSLFHQPLLSYLPTPITEAIDDLPGLGPSGGFVAQVLSEPSGAEVRIDGTLRGTTPFFGNVACRRDEEVTVEVAAEGWTTWRRVLTCRQEGTLKITARLAR